MQIAERFCGLGGGLNGVAHNVTGLFYGGGVSQLLAQAIDVVVCAVWSFGVGYAFFKIQSSGQHPRT